MNTGVLAHKLIKHTHCGYFILCLTYYVLSIASHTYIVINTHRFWWTDRASFSTRGGIISIVILYGYELSIWGVQICGVIVLTVACILKRGACKFNYTYYFKNGILQKMSRKLIREQLEFENTYVQEFLHVWKTN